MDAIRQCDRCGESYGDKDFRGRLCGWCSADLDAAAPDDQGERIELSDADVAILWHARMAQEDRNAW